MIRCANCGDDVSISESMILWNLDCGSDAVVVHRGKNRNCNIREYKNSGGSAWGTDWYTDADVVERFLNLNHEKSSGLRELYEAMTKENIL